MCGYLNRKPIFSVSVLFPLLAVIAGCNSLIGELERIEKRYHDVNPVCANPAPGSVTPIYPGLSNWLSFVLNDGTSPLNASGTQCIGSDTGHSNTCLHAGEMRRVPVTNRTDCTGLTASDSLAAYKWGCAMIGGVPNMISGGLADERLLSHLIDFSGTGSWRPNAVTVSDACGSASTPASLWHTNPIIKDFTDPAATLQLQTQGNVFIFTTNPGKPLEFGTHRIALVGMPGIIFTTTGAAPHISMNGALQWLEATLDSSGTSSWSIELANSRFAILRGVNASRRNIHVANTHYANVRYLRLFNGEILFDSAGPSTYNIANSFYHTIITNGRIDFESAESWNNIFIDLTLANSSYGFSTGNGPSIRHNIVINHTGANTDTAGLRGSPFNDNTFMNIALVNSQGTAFTPEGTRNQTINLAAGVSDAGLLANTTNGYFSGLLKLGGNTTNCYGSVATSGISNTCTVMGASDFTSSNTLNLSAAFVGKVTTDDSINTQDTSGSATFAGITNFFGFENRYRGWGRENAAAAFAAGHRGLCTGGGCRIWDLTPRAADNQIRSVLPLPGGNDTYMHRWEATNFDACNAIRNAVWEDTVCRNPGYSSAASCTGSGEVWQTGLCSTRALRNAFEILNDARGNDNGICESNEACIYTPNIGAYQGHGQLVRVGRISDGVIIGVELWRYQNNGI